MKYYALLIAADVLFSLQFLFNQRYQRNEGNTWRAALTFTIYTSAVGFAGMLLLNGLRFEITGFALGVACVAALSSVAYSYASIRALSVVNLSVYSVFAMLGGMLLPFLFGILFRGEPLTWPKGLCCAAIALSLLLTAEKGKNTGGWRYYGAVFVLNGLSGVLSTIHQSSPRAVSSTGYMALSMAAALTVSSIIWLFTQKGLPRVKLPSAGFACGYAALTSAGNLFALLALKHIQASVQYPIITGGVMALSLLISALRREKLTWRNYLSTAVAFAATVLIAL